MITLFTGLPGGGKTALALSMLMPFVGKRPIFVDGIPQLQIPHEKCPKLPEWTEHRDDESSESGKKICFTFPAESIILIDEAQRIYRPRAAASKVPDYVAAFETHRHEGIDFWIITQRFSLIDPNLRGLVDRHIHVRETFTGRYQYEWFGLGDPDSKTSRDIAARSKYKLPKHVFGKYKSAITHTTTKRRRPFMFYASFFIFAALAFGIYRVYSSIKAKLDPQPTLSMPGQARHEPGQASSGSIPVGDWLDARKPRIDGIVMTAPVYDKVREPVRVPYPAACVVMHDDCRCYTDQATRLTVSRDMCEQIVQNGFYVDWDQEKGKAKNVSTAAASPLPTSAQAVPIAPSASSVGSVPVDNLMGAPTEAVGRGHWLPPSAMSKNAAKG